MYMPAGIALEKLFELAGIEILALTSEFDLQLLDEVVHTKRIHWLGNIDQLKA